MRVGVQNKGKPAYDTWTIPKEIQVILALHVGTHICHFNIITGSGITAYNVHIVIHEVKKKGADNTFDILYC